MKHLVIVPNALRDEINAKLDAALAEFPECKQQDRDQLFAELLAYYDDHGVIPDFSLKINEGTI